MLFGSFPPRRDRRVAMIDRDSLKGRLTKVVETILDRASTLTDPSVAAAADMLGVELQSLSILRAERAFHAAVASVHIVIDTNVGGRSNRLAVSSIERMVDSLEVMGIPPEEQRQGIVAEHEIVTGRWKVSLDLHDSTPLRFIRRANEVSELCFGSPAVHPHLVNYWERWPELGFTTRHSSDTHIGVNGYIPQSLSLNRREQVEAGCIEVPLFKLAVAHAAYRLAARADLFNGFAVRAYEGAVLLASAQGLEEYLGLTDQAPRPIGGALLLDRIHRRGEAEL